MMPPLSLNSGRNTQLLSEKYPLKWTKGNCSWWHYQSIWWRREEEGSRETTAKAAQEQKNERKNNCQLSSGK